MGAKTKLGTVLSAVAVALILWPVQPVYSESSQESSQAQNECDRYMMAHTRSAARKLGRAIDRGEYGFNSLSFGDEVVIPGDKVGLDEPLRLEVRLEKMGEVAVAVDRSRHWEQTYVIADAAFGPIVISKTWEARDERADGADCRPFISVVERPAHPASSVDVEPFRYWGMRAGWRIPSPEMVEESNLGLEEALKQTVIGFASSSSDE